MSTITHGRWGGNQMYWQTLEAIGQTATSVLYARTYAKAGDAHRPTVNALSELDATPDYRDDETATERLERLIPRYKHGV